MVRQQVPNDAVAQNGDDHSTDHSMRAKVITPASFFFSRR